MKASSKIERRKFLQISALSASGLALGYLFTAGKEPSIAQADITDDSLEAYINPYIIIGKDGKITILNSRPEMGQGTFESIPMIIAEELEADINAINILTAPADRSKYGAQYVYGSLSIHEDFALMRKIGASAREMFIAAAAAKWNISKDDCYAKNGFVINKSNHAKLSYGELVDDAKKIPAPENPTLKDPKDFTIIGTTVPRKDIPLKTNGTAQFGIDIHVPGMLYASVERSPVLLGKIIGYDAEKAKTVAGVKYVLKTERNVLGQKREGIAVIADNYWAAVQGRKLLQVKWDNADLEQWNTQKIKDKYAKAALKDGETFDHKGDFAKAIESAALKIQSSYETPYQSHAPMEPINVVVSVEKNKCTFWGSTQDPNAVKSFLAKKLNIPEENVTVNYTFLGGGFGKRTLTDAAEEAANLSMQTGTPVKVIWSREDDLTQGPYRACQLNVCSGAIDRNGNIIALAHQVISQEIWNQYNGATKASGDCTDGINTAYAIPNYAISAVLQQMYIPVYYWRSVYHSTNCFAHESFIDELAHAAKKDPLQLRLSLLQHHARYTKVLQTVAEKSQWFQPREKDTGKGVAIVERSGAFVAMVAEIKRIDGKIKPVKITVAVDCGMPVNPGNIKAQMEGCVVMGLTAAYKSSITIDQGKIVEQNFDTYKMLRIQECPQIDVHVIQTTEPPNGAGEAALPTVAPALTNAIFELTQKRIRVLPFNLDEV